MLILVKGADTAGGWGLCLVALRTTVYGSFSVKATWLRSLSEGVFKFRNVQHLPFLWWITTWWKLKRLSNHIWLPFCLLGGSKSCIYGNGQNFWPRGFFPEQNQGNERRRRKKFFCGKLWDNPRFSGSPKCIQSDNVSEMLFCLGEKKNMNFNDICMLDQDQIQFLTLCRACGV